MWIAKAAATGIQKGDLHSLSTILDRVLGKPKERHELTGKDGEELRFGETEAAAKLAAIFAAARARKDK